MIFGLGKQDAGTFRAFAGAFEAWADSLKPEVRPRVRRSSDRLEAEFVIKGSRVENAFVEAMPGNAEINIGGAWQEFETPSAQHWNFVLAFMQALATGRVREVRLEGSSKLRYYGRLSSHGYRAVGIVGWTEVRRRSWRKPRRSFLTTVTLLAPEV